MNNLFFSSDHHFFHDNVIRFCNRPFRDLDHMHEELIRRYNSRVKSGDTCIFVGDISFGNAAETKNILNQMSGIKILITGNHDKKCTRNKFNICLEETKILIAGEEVSIKHYPLKWSLFSHIPERIERFIKRVPDPRYLERHIVDKGQFHIHGHTHSTEKFRDNQIHVGVDAWDYYPVPLKEISKYIQQYKIKSRRGKK